MRVDVVCNIVGGCELAQEGTRQRAHTCLERERKREGYLLFREDGTKERGLYNALLALMSHRFPA